jgi:hypothetical protein
MTTVYRRITSPLASDVESSSWGRTQNVMSDDDISYRWRAQYLSTIETRINQMLGSSSHGRLRLRVTRFFLLGWPALCVTLILARLFHFLALPWLLILAPIWLPIGVIAVLLLAAMWLDKSASRLND